MASISLEKDLLLVALLRQWAKEHGLEEQLCVFMGACIEQQKNPFTGELASILEEAGKALAGFMPNCNGHAINKQNVMEGLETGDTIKPSKSYAVDLHQLKKSSGPNVVRAWLQPLAPHTPVTGNDILAVMEENLRGFKLRSSLQRRAAADNVAFALRAAGILDQERNGKHYRRARFFKTEKIGNRSTDRIIQIYLDGKIPFRKKTKAKAKARK